ncbi:MAG: hypothetical protein ACKOSQ_10185 [Planctomycetaceae bacterium]
MSHRAAILAVVLAMASFLPCAASAADQAASPGGGQDVLGAEQAGLAEVRYIPNDSRSAQVIVTNRADRPLTLRLPAAFAGVPVLAQFMNNGGGNNNQAGFGAGGIGAAPQSTGGGAQNAGMGIGGGAAGGGGNPFCWVAREVYGAHDPRWVEFRTWMTVDAPRWLRDGYVAHGEAFADWIHDRPVAKQIVRAGMDAAIAGHADAVGGGQFQVGPAQADGSFVVQPGGRRVFRFATVCLEHGKPEPSPRVPYKLVALESFSKDPRLPVVMAALASGQVSQKTAQAAAWHLANGLSWEQLAAEMIDHAGGDPDEPFFGPTDLVAARGLVAEAERIAAAPAPVQPSSASAE